MFKKPFEVKIDAHSLEVQHEIVMTPNTFNQIDHLLEKTEKSTIRTILIGAAAVATSQIIVHIAKTKIQ